MTTNTESVAMTSLIVEQKWSDFGVESNAYYKPFIEFIKSIHFIRN